MKKFNLHLHTNYSDGHEKMENYIPIMKELGYSCLITSDHDYMMDEIKFENQVEESIYLKNKFDFQIFNGLEITLGIEEAILLNPNMCMDWFVHKSPINCALRGGDATPFKEWIDEWDKKDYALVLVHPHGCYGSASRTNPEIYSYFDAYEVMNHGTAPWLFNGTSDILKRMMPSANQIAGLDAHGLSFIQNERQGSTYNLIKEEDSPKSYEDIYDIIKNKNYVINPEIMSKFGIELDTII